jgi:hypothetical protein
MDAMRHMERVDFGYQDVSIYINFGDVWTRRLLVLVLVRNTAGITTH